MYTGVTLALFHSSGTEPLFIDTFNMCVIDGAMIGAAALRSLALTLSMPVALAAQRVESCFQQMIVLFVRN